MIQDVLFNSLMMVENEMTRIDLPKKLLSGFLDFAQKINLQSNERGLKFTDEEIERIFEASFSGRVRAFFFTYLGDLNHILEGIDLILGDLRKMRDNKESMGSNPVVRSELLFRSFFNEFFLLKETSKPFLKKLVNAHVLDAKNRKEVSSFYSKAFEWVYDLRNMFVHESVTFRNDHIKINSELLKDISSSEREKFIALLNQANTRENTVEIQCAIYMKIINEILPKYLEFQDFLNDFYANLILSYEDVIEIVHT